jgi:hypothetical protein
MLVAYPARPNGGCNGGWCGGQCALLAFQTRETPKGIFLEDNREGAFETIFETTVAKCLHDHRFLSFHMKRRTETGYSENPVFSRFVSLTLLRGPHKTETMLPTRNTVPAQSSEVQMQIPIARKACNLLPPCPVAPPAATVGALAGQYSGWMPR